jgi:hypothetical protein
LNFLQGLTAEFHLIFGGDIGIRISAVLVALKLWGPFFNYCTGWGYNVAFIKVLTPPEHQTDQIKIELSHDISVLKP